jgi:hypothetical protein
MCAMPGRLRLRQFVYLDESLTNNFLAQVEGGVYDEESQTSTSGQERKRGAGGNVGPVKAELSGSRTGQDVTSRTVRQLADGAFTRLADRLEQDDAVQWLEALDDDIWRQLRRGEVLEVEATLTMPTIFQIRGLAGNVGPILELMRATGEEIDAEATEGLRMASMMGQLFKDPVALATPSGAPEYTVILPLDAQWLRVDTSDLHGDVTVFGTLERKLRDGDQWSLLDAVGLSALPNAQEMVDSLEAITELEGSVVRPPAAVLKPVAIYR